MLRENHNKIFVFGDNAARWGRGGQAKEMRGEPNAVGIATKWTPYEYFSDDRYDEQVKLIEHDMEPLFEAIMNGITIVLPEGGIGTGLAAMPQCAPKTWAFLQNELFKLQAISDEIDGNTVNDYGC